MAEAKRGRNTERINVWLTPDQVAWLKTKKNASETVRALVAEAMSIDALKASVVGATAKKSAKAPAKTKKR